MANIITPKINRIVRLRSFDLNATPINKGDMYMCLDTLVMYYDQDDSNRVRYIYKGVKTRKDMLYNITPVQNTTYYCWEDNSLWLWMNKWISIYSSSEYPSAYIIEDSQLKDIYNYNSPNAPIDNNGLLGDGSVVVRDDNRLIKGKIYIDTDNNNLIISSYFGGGTRVLPNGQMSTKGELFLNANEDPDYGTLESHIIGPFTVKDGELYVDYSNNVNDDDSEYPNSEHKYKVYHEGNLNASAIKEITPSEIYSKLQSDELANPLNLNVSYLGGYRATDFAMASHTHTSNDISNFNTAITNETQLQLKTMMNNVNSKGVTVSYNNQNNQLDMSADNFTIILTGDVTGSATVQNLTSTTIKTTLNTDLLNIQSLSDRVDAVEAMVNTQNLSLYKTALANAYTTTIGNNVDKQFTITHNLNSTNLLVQFRDTVTGKQLDLYNVTINENELLVTTNEVLQNNQVSVNIIKI